MDYCRSDSQVVELSAIVERFEAESIDKHKLYLAEGKYRDTESKLELEILAKNRLEVRLIRKDNGF